MSVAELKLKIFELVLKENDEHRLRKILALVSKQEFRHISANEAFEEVNGRYSETLRKLAD